ncbi:DNA-(apurinic or apyrimidinic site) lyase [Perkinsus olseni]|uniref:DNA-(Apurinic or apyrimidinic site) lyase n=1 Tax=Perkinsus olseni TaxID=32597 RepID=A0A7J6LMS5_PEROL|nr:DNA-(apurinic or apyrimidinic site) lyase [Perkinsus olseni]
MLLSVVFSSGWVDIGRHRSSGQCVWCGIRGKGSGVLQCSTSLEYSESKSLIHYDGEFREVFRKHSGAKLGSIIPMESGGDKMERVKEVISEIIQDEANDSDDCRHLMGMLPELERAMSSTRAARAVYDEAWATIHTGHYTKVHHGCREAFAVAACCLALLEKSTFYADMGIMIGGPSTRSYELLEEMCRDITAASVPVVQPEKRVRRAFPAGKEKPPVLKHPVEELEVSECSFEKFLTQYFIPQKPVKIRGLVSSWPGVQSWADPDHWTLGKYGDRLVPIELGGYMSSGYSQRLMKLRDYVEEHLMKPASDAADQSIAYLAEYEIFNQITELEEEVQPVPDACLSADEGIVRRLLFFGAAGTASQTHRDANNNIKCMVVGCKYVRLFSPSQEKCLYPLQRGILTNNSTLPTDILTEPIDPEKYPLYSEVVYSEAILNAGDALFLPSNWWHFIKSYEVTASIAHFFR